MKFPTSGNLQYRAEFPVHFPENPGNSALYCIYNFLNISFGRKYRKFHICSSEMSSSDLTKNNVSHTSSTMYMERGNR